MGRLVDRLLGRRTGARGPRWWIVRAAASVGALAAVAALALLAWIAWPLPRALTAPDAAPGLRLEDRHGIALRVTRAVDGSRTRWVPLAELDPDLLAAFVAVEDRRFHEHGGVDVRAVARAARDNALAGRVVSGASTITMQLAHLLRPAAGRGGAGKAAQALWALRLERHLSKQAILEQYLNRIHLGQATVGVGSAAALYFGASARDVSLGQAALLAGIARAPSRDNPLVAPARARARRSAALERLRAAGYAPPADVARALEEPTLVRGLGAPFLAPHFTSHLLATGEARGTPGGVRRTSLDLPLQEELAGEVRHAVDLLRDRGAAHAAAVVLHNRTGEILAWVGSPDFWEPRSGQTDMVASPRQPGSALKPFLYALAFDRGYTPASVLPDVALTFRTVTGPYRPRNYDRRLRGPVRAREALASSYNVPAVELANQVGAGSLLRTLRLAGFTSLDRGADHYGLGLALGNGDVTLLELANGYRALANGGVWRPYRWDAVRAGVATEGEESRRVVSAASAALVLDVLADAEARIPGFGFETPFDFPFPVAVKTGTSRHYTDNWAVGTAGEFTVAVWVGNFSGRPMEGVSGVSGAGPLLHRAVLLTARRHAPGTLPTPRAVGARAVAICRLSGKRATAACPRMTEWLAPGTPEPDLCDWHDDRGGVHLPAEYDAWARQHGAGALAGVAHRGAALHAAAEPPGSDSAAADRRFRIVSPQDGDVYRVPPGVSARFATVALQVAGGRPGAVVRWWVDGRPSAAGRLALVPGPHVVRAEAGGGASAEVRFSVER